MLRRTRSSRHRSSELATILSLSSDGIIAFDQHNCVNYVSPAFQKMTGLTMAQLKGADEETFWAQLSLQCHPEHTQTGIAQLRHHLAAPERQRRSVLELVQPVACMLKVSQSVSIGTRIAKVVCFRDVSQEVDMDRRKSEFLSTAAHELRSPLASIHGFSEALLTQPFSDAERQEFTDIIYQQSKFMTTLLNDMLDLARIEARRHTDLVFERLSAHALVSLVLAGFRREPGRILPDISAPQRPLCVLVDREKFQQVLVNVLSNAYKYSAHGSTIAIEIESIAQDDGKAEVAIHVRDHGIGMTVVQLAHLFERFYRANTTSKVLGTGLGMSIVQQIMTLLDGRVTVQSVAGRGTCVSLFFPAA